MGNENSGRRRMRGKEHLEQLLSFSMGDIKQYLLQIGAAATLTWTDRGSISLGIGESKVLAAFCVGGKEMEQEIQIVYTPCNFGKFRPWVQCQCGARVGNLYLTSEFKFLCRRCTGFTYRSKSLSALERSVLTLRRIKRKIDPKNSYQPEHIPHKRKWMHEATYQRLAAEIQNTFNGREAILKEKLAAALKRMRVRVEEDRQNRPA